MSTITNLIFKNRRHHLSSPYGPRESIKTSQGATARFHTGADYSTEGKKLFRYAIDDGVIVSCGKDEYGGKFVWVSYDSLKVKMLHYHLDSIAVKYGQCVKKGDKLGTTGQSGMATGVHLHLAIKGLEYGNYFDPEKWSAREYPKLLEKKKNPKYRTGTYRVAVSLLHVRKNPGVRSELVPFEKLSKNAKERIKALSYEKRNGYVKGVIFTCSEIFEADLYCWGKTPSGWVALDYCERVK